MPGWKKRTRVVIVANANESPLSVCRRAINYSPSTVTGNEQREQLYENIHKLPEQTSRPVYYSLYSALAYFFRDA